MFSIFSYIMSRVTHSEPGLPMLMFHVIHTRSKVMQWPPQRQVRKDVCRENSLKEDSSLE